MRRLAAVLALALAAPAGAQVPRLALPLACALGETCYIRHYPDRDPGAGVRDHACGTASYDGHDGTDFALPTLSAMAAGVSVLAAAPGTVTASRDGEPDGDFAAGAAVAGRECGNGVMIDHGAGWQSQYCHLASGSVMVAPGDRVAAGTTLGRVGLSGKSEFPHLHLTLRHNGVTVDPFAPDPAATCPADAAAALWQLPPPYQPAGLLDLGLGLTAPEYASVKAGAARANVLPAKAPQLILWGYGWGVREGDVLALTLTGPKGYSFAHEARITRDQALFYRYAGARIPSPAGWPQGSYTATARLLRAGSAIDTRQAQFRVEG
ncbi:MAG: M23 family metallopeptidase [Phaeovulum sp.]|uniref:M23 family metallopeptidase n=1 Tax=Phaeovulum sp. TaxID=2934796 RepID=UPI002734693F|nr:M23 family metallopeptidase [Phaeovulum sp.]MDP3862715.1 M23 family metallopeptidase [Phaeovulum sp.]